jgi:hypothetical protein
MDNIALTLIAVTLFLLVIIVGLLTVLIFKLTNKDRTFTVPTQTATGEAPHPDISRTEFHPAILERIKEAERLKPKRSDLFCPNHTEEPGETACAICDKLFCKACIKPFKSLHFCKEHIPLIMRHDWDEVITIKTSTQDPERGVRLYDLKKKILEESDLPTYFETHYKINVDQDYIETYLVLYAIRENVESVREKLTLLD